MDKLKTMRFAVEFAPSKLAAARRHPLLIQLLETISEEEIDNLETITHPLLSFKIYEIGRRIILAKGEEQEAAKRDLIDCLKVLERELGDKPFLGGETLGLVDVARIPFYSWFYGYGKCGGFSIETQCPKLIAWAKRCSQKDSISKSLANREKVYGFMLELKKRFGVD